ncbi:MAG: CoA transferase [Gemmatimonadetes bacterium]|nr:CoA transferase [Gemmatimonadota bacterium]
MDPKINGAALEGLRVVELGQFLAGPFCAQIMADFGARVVKVEPPLGDPLRRWRELHGGTSLWWYNLNRNKQSIAVDLRTPAGQDVARALIAQADIVVENFRPGTLESWNLGWEQLRAINPRLVMVRISGFGQDGPYRDRTGFGAVGESMGGLRYLTGWPDRPPTRINLSLGDSVAAMWGVIGALNAIYYRDVAGKGTGQLVDVALYEGVFALLESTLSEYGYAGIVRQRSGTALPGIAPSNTYQTRDGKEVIIAGNGDRIFPRLMQAIGRPDFASDPKFATNPGRAAHANELDAAIGAWTAGRTLEEALSAMDAAGVPAGPIYTIADIAKDEHYLARGAIQDVDVPGLGRLKMPGVFPKLSESPGRISWAGPRIGEHNRAVLQGVLGISDEDFQKLAAAGVIREEVLADTT